MMARWGIENLGMDCPNQGMVNFTRSMALNTQLKTIERHAGLHYLEQGLTQHRNW